MEMNVARCGRGPGVPGAVNTKSRGPLVTFIAHSHPAFVRALGNTIEDVVAAIRFRPIVTVTWIAMQPCWAMAYPGCRSVCVHSDQVPYIV